MCIELVFCISLVTSYQPLQVQSDTSEKNEEGLTVATLSLVPERHPLQNKSVT